MHAITSYCSNRPTYTQTHTHTQTDRTDYNTLRRSFASAQCNHMWEMRLRPYYCLEFYIQLVGISVSGNYVHSVSHFTVIAFVEEVVISSALVSCLSVGLIVSVIAQKLLNLFSQNSVARSHGPRKPLDFGAVIRYVSVRWG